MFPRIARCGQEGQTNQQLGLVQVHVLALGVCVLTSVKKLGKIKAILKKGETDWRRKGSKARLSTTVTQEFGEYSSRGDKWRAA